jgi:hypothetical protein
MQNNDAQKLADKIAKLIAAESTNTDLSSLRKSIDAIGVRLEKLEISPLYPKVQISKIGSEHPSQDRFAVAEAIVDNLFDRDAEEKACTFEPNGKPCDHCSLCNSRGF